MPWRMTGRNSSPLGAELLASGAEASEDSVASSEAAPVASSEMPGTSGTAAASGSDVALELVLLPQAASSSVDAVRNESPWSRMVPFLEFLDGEPACPRRKQSSGAGVTAFNPRHPGLVAG